MASPCALASITQYGCTMKNLIAMILIAAGGMAAAAPVKYNIDPTHTFPSFEADHMGISVWRGKFNKSRGSVMLDKETGSGSVDIEIDTGSVDFGHDALNKWAAGKDFFDTKKFGPARYKGKLDAYVNGVPTRVTGELTLHGVTKPVDLRLNLFKCIAHPLTKKDLCGADAVGLFRRDDFGLVAGKDYGFNMDVNLRIQVEAVAAK
jgi:polyisoprenoid-binding protein YceI